MSYDPNQPRVPKDHEGGGRWTRGDYGPLLEPQFASLRRDASRFVIQKLKMGIEAALALYARQSLHNGPYQQTVIEFTAREYQRDDTNSLILSQVRTLTRAEVNNVCKRLEDVERTTEQAVLEVQTTRPYLGPAQYGTDVHTALKRIINNEKPGLPDFMKPPDPNFKAEASSWKAREDLAAITGIHKNKIPHYAALGTIRVDVFERLDGKTVCVYDIKTGTSVRSGLSPERMEEIALSIFLTYGAVRIIITEVRPMMTRPGR